MAGIMIIGKIEECMVVAQPNFPNKSQFCFRHRQARALTHTTHTHTLYIHIINIHITLVSTTLSNQICFPSLHPLALFSPFCPCFIDLVMPRSSRSSPFVSSYRTPLGKFGDPLILVSSSYMSVPN